MGALLGCIADDFTGGTDLAGMLVKSGMRTIQTVGVPKGPAPTDVDAIVVALKSRTVPAEDAVRESLAALRWLQDAGCRQFYFKYCSTFDSTPKGNIGTVAEALMEALGTKFTIACPAFPANRRTIYKGVLFVGDTLLNESGMERHPLTPMTDSNLVRVLGTQVKHAVGLADYNVVSRGAAAIASRFAELQAEGRRFAVVDAVDNEDLMQIGRACADMPLVTAGSGVALGLPANFVRAGLLTPRDASSAFATPKGLRAVVSGSCSQATQGQVAAMKARWPAFQVDALRMAQGHDVVAEALDWANSRLEAGPVLVYATDTPEHVASVQRELGTERAAELVERTLADIALGLVQRGVRQLLVAGGETSGAVVKRLGVDGLRIGPEIDPGVPWTLSMQRDSERPSVALALKSGNFGTPDFFLKAWDYLPQ